MSIMSIMIMVTFVSRQGLNEHYDKNEQYDKGCMRIIMARVTCKGYISIVSRITDTLPSKLAYELGQCYLSTMSRVISVWCQGLYYYGIKGYIEGHIRIFTSIGPGLHQYCGEVYNLMR